MPRRNTKLAVYVWVHSFKNREPGVENRQAVLTVGLSVELTRQ